MRRRKPFQDSSVMGLENFLIKEFNRSESNKYYYSIRLLIFT